MTYLANVKPCLKFNVQGSCFDNCNNKLSHKKLKGEDFKKTDEFIKNIRSEFNRHFRQRFSNVLLITRVPPDKVEFKVDLPIHPASIVAKNSILKFKKKQNNSIIRTNESSSTINNDSHGDSIHAQVQRLKRELAGESSNKACNLQPNDSVSISDATRMKAFFKEEELNSSHDLPNLTSTYVISNLSNEYTEQGTIPEVELPPLPTNFLMAKPFTGNPVIVCPGDVHQTSFQWDRAWDTHQAYQTSQEVDGSKHIWFGPNWRLAHCSLASVSECSPSLVSFSAMCSRCMTEIQVHHHSLFDADSR